MRKLCPGDSLGISNLKQLQMKLSVAFRLKSLWGFIHVIRATTNRVVVGRVFVWPHLSLPNKKRHREELSDQDVALQLPSNDIHPPGPCSFLLKLGKQTKSQLNCMQHCSPSVPSSSRRFSDSFFFYCFCCSKLKTETLGTMHFRHKLPGKTELYNLNIFEVIVKS